MGFEMPQPQQSATEQRGLLGPSPLRPLAMPGPPPGCETHGTRCCENPLLVFAIEPGLINTRNTTPPHDICSHPVNTHFIDYLIPTQVFYTTLKYTCHTDNILWIVSSADAVAKINDNQADEAGPDAKVGQVPQEEEDLHRLNRVCHIAEALREGILLPRRCSFLMLVPDRLMPFMGEAGFGNAIQL
ncbi:hypothetical protein PIB30_059028 [Stylosanthes scabra]|uniref:Uncharacterized protein n=1 Tax=Stylosanthes scabra TaxID=79078 RepID=A0ABU6SLE7_9FABA|nr:hypothetical protein [Stylosanthes scabra]